MQVVNITIPVFNEQGELARNVERLLAFLAAQTPELRYEIIIANNASTDGTLDVARNLERKHDLVHVVHISQKGRGRALKQAWRESSAHVFSYMDVDLSTDLEFFPRLIAPLLGGTKDLAIGSRLLRPAMTTRGLKRELTSRSYNFLIGLLFHAPFSDAQCGFKAITRRAAAELIPLVEDNSWFFDTELLLWAVRLGYRIHDLPVRWTDDPDSRVKIFRTAIDDIKGLLRVRRTFLDARHSSLRNARAHSDRRWAFFK